MSFSPIPVYVWGHALEDGKPTTFLPEAVNHQYLLRKGYSLESTSPTYTEALPDWIVCRLCTSNGCCVFLSVLGTHAIPSKEHFTDSVTISSSS